jgi:NTP pyrophosphatase (non-canonical NTP hydrolase)
MTDLTVKEAQKILKNFIKSKNWDRQPLSVDVAFLAEETGEVAKEALSLEITRKENKTKEKAVKDLAEELADVFYWTMKIANRYNINLDKTFLEKLEKIKKRK